MRAEKARSIYVLINGKVIVQPAAEDFRFTPMAVTYAVTVLDGRSYQRYLRICEAISQADVRPSLLR